jgi:hypothetical protein
MIMFECNSFGRCVYDAATRMNFYSHQDICGQEIFGKKIAN